MRLAATLAAVLFLAMSAAQVRAASPDVVISQVYGGGGNSGAALRNDFIELFNRGQTPASLAGWSVQYASSTGATWQVTPLPAFTLQPGQYFLVREGAGAGGTTDLPTPDAAHSTPSGIAMAAGAGKVALVIGTAPLACGSACAGDAAVKDLVGYGNANNAEGTPAPTLSNTTAALRVNHGCIDNDNNGVDFTEGAPAPRNSASPIDVCPLPPVVASCPASLSIDFGAGGLAALSASDADGLVSAGAITSAPVSGISLAFTPASGTGGTANGSLQVGAGTALGSYNVQIQFSNNDAAPQSATCTVTVSVVPPPVAARIREIQGAAHLSPLNGQRVLNVTGIVTALRSNGFYMQDPEPDSDPATSEGMFVFTSIAPAVSVGDALSVNGRVTEFRAGGADGLNNLTLTEIVSPVITVLSSGNALPAPVLVGIGGRIPPRRAISSGSCLERNVENASATCTFDPAHDGIDFWESLESMRVTLRHAVATGPTNGFGEIPVVANFGLAAGPRTARGGVRVAERDFNPERVFLDDGILPTPTVNVGDVFAVVTGVMDYTFANFKLQVIEPLTVTSGGLAPEVTGAQEPNQLAIASFNVENLAPTNPPEKFAALAAQIVNNLRSPDVVALMEVQDNNGALNDGTVDASLTFNLLAMAVEAAGGPAYQFRSIDPVNNQDGGEPGGNIRVGFFFNPARVAFVDRPGGGPTVATTVVAGADGPQLSSSPGRVDPNNVAFNANTEAGTFPSRKPLAGEFVFKGHRLFVVANHFNSKGGDQPLFGRFQPPLLVTEAQRLRQATVVRDFVRSILALDRHAKVVVLGDLNDFEFSPPLELLKDAPLHDLVELLPPAERYTYVFEGNSQVLDHILVSESLLRGVEYDIVHVNSEFAAQTSDHEPEVARLHLPPEVDEVTRKVDVRSSKLRFDRATREYVGTVTVTNDSRQPIAGPLQIVLDRLERGVKLVNAVGTHRGDPYLTSPGALAPRAAVTVPVRFRAQERERDIDYKPRVFTGSFE